MPAQAAAGDDSIAEASFLSGSLLANLLPVGLDLGSSSASNDGTQPLRTETSGIDALVGASADLGLVEIPLALADVGALGTFAQAANNGSSIAASGIANIDGDIGVALVDAADVPSALSLDLGEVLAGGFATELTRLQLDVGAVSSRAESAAAATATGDYEIVGSQLLLTSDTIAGVSETVDSLAGTLSGAVDAVAGPGGSLLGAVTSTASAAFDTVGVVSLGDTSASVSLDLPGAIAPLLAELRTGPPLNPGPVTVNLLTGEVAIDLAALKGGSLSELPANTAVLTSAELIEVSDAVTTILGEFADELEEVVTTALDAAAVQIDVNLQVRLPLTSIAIDLADISVSGTLAQLASGSGDITVDSLVVVPIVSGVVDGLASALVAPLGLVVSPLVAALLDPEVGALKAFTDRIQTGVVTPVAELLNPLLLTLDTILAMTVNNQELIGTAPEQQFVETALRVGLLAQGPVASLLELDVARSAVGPNHSGVRPVISDVDPTSGPATGGTAVTITGTDFDGSTGVTFDGVAATDFVVVSDTEITITTPAHAAGAVDVIIQHPAGASDAGEFTYTPVPVISSLTPDFGPIAGGTVVTITGSEFMDATGVTFDGTDGTAFTVDSDTQITVTSPAHALGAVDLIIERASGNSAPATFTYRGAPTASGLTPTEGPLAGGTEVTITGTGFTGSTGVTFDGDAGTSFTIVSDTEITVSSPAHVEGTIAVVVLHPIGDAAAGDFTYTAAPIISSLSPNSGPTVGGTVVTVTGAGFTGATGVTFDGDAGTSFTVVSDTEITVTAPANPAGPTDVIVLSSPANSAPGTFTYIAPPTVTNVTPNSGPVTGGTVVTIEGSNLTDTTDVTFDGDAGTSLTIVSDTEITITTPAHVQGTVPIVVEHPGGDTGAGNFEYLPIPVVASLTPATGPTAGGTVVTITGSGFTGATGVTFDGNDGTSFTVESDTEITVTSPANSAGDADVVVTHANGNSAPVDFTYVAPPAVTSISPDEGPLAGGTVVTITGSGFTGATGVTFDGDDGTSFTVVSDTEITVTSPAHAAGEIDVVVTHAMGNSTPADFTYLAPPTVSSISPDEGPLLGGTEVTIIGSGFTGATGVTFDGDDGTSFTVVSDTEITVTTPAGTEGTATVVVEHPNGNVDGGDFAYLAAPVITGITPVAGPTSGGTAVTLTGYGFTGATGVTFDGDDGTSFIVVSDTEITVSSPAHAIGPVEVTVVHPGGASIPATFTYRADPTVTLVSPNAGPLEGGTEVTITGTGLTGATGVTFDGVEGTDFTVVSDTEITVTSPPRAAGAAEIVIQHPIADTTAGDFTYAAAGIPVVNSMFPLVGPDSGGTLVTLRGSGFLGATGARFGAFWGSNFTVLSDTMATVMTPAHEAMWVPAVLSASETMAATPGFTFEPTTLAESDANTGTEADADGDLAYTGSAGFRSAWAALLLISAGVMLMISRRPAGRHRA